MTKKEKKKNIEPVLVGNKMYFIDGSLYEDLLNDIKSNYIPKQKLRDKMKEKEWVINDGYDSSEASYGESQAIGAYVALAELLNEKEE